MKKTLAQRFFAKTLRDDKPAPYGLAIPCLLWIGGKNDDGYGRMWGGDQVVSAHRLAFRMANGHDPEPECRHKCHIRNCVEPSHLDEGTHAQNMRDMAEADRCGATIHPERMARGDNHWSRRSPELMARGDKNGARSRPERVVRGERRAFAKLTTEDIPVIRAAPGTQDEVASRFGISQTTVSRIRLGKKWKHVP